MEKKIYRTQLVLFLRAKNQNIFTKIGTFTNLTTGMGNLNLTSDFTFHIKCVEKQFRNYADNL